MRAYILDEAGGTEKFNLRDIKQPIAQKNEVLIEVKAVSINPVDAKARAVEEVIEMIMGVKPPVILGWDIAGVVVATGKNVTQFKEGDSVFGMINFPGQGKGYAQFVTAPENHLALMPVNTSFEEAAATTLAALTALQVLRAKVKPGDKILIHAGAGGVGHFAIQIAKHFAAHVIATSSAKNKDFVMSLGADEHIDYQNQHFEKNISNIDFVLDGMGGEVLKNSLQVVKKGGAIVSLPSGEFSPKIQSTSQQKNIKLSFVLVESNGDDMKTLKKFIEDGVLKPHVSDIFSFSELPKAHQQIESGRTVGKIVVKL